MVERVEKAGFQAHKIVGVERTVVACVGEERGKDELAQLEFFAGVDSVMPILKPYKLASREVHPGGSVVKVGKVEIGAKRLVVMAGPCAIESAAQMQGAAQAVKAAGAHMLRGGAFKPRTSPYSFQGMEHDGLLLLERAGHEVGLPVVTEVMDPHDIEQIAEHADMLQVGARNAQNFSLLRRLGKVNKPILLKRGMSTKLDEFLMAAEYILSAGNTNVVLCERGIRTFETATRNTLDLNAIPRAQGMDSPADNRGSQPWHRRRVAGDSDGVGGDRGGRRRLDDRGPSRTRKGAFRRPAAVASGAFCRIDALAAAGGGGGRSHGVSNCRSSRAIACGNARGFVIA